MARRRTDFDLSDHVRLRRELLSRPAAVLRQFGRCQIGSLAELEVYRNIRRSDPAAADRIAAEARKLGIPE